MKLFLRSLLPIWMILFLITAALAGPRAEIRGAEGNPALLIDGRPYPPVAYMSYLGETRFYREAAEAGIHLYCFPAYLGNRGINTSSGIGPFRPALWNGPEEFDFSSLEQDFSKILAADPEALVIIRIHLDVPEWWEARHPEECALLPGGKTARQSFSSRLWREDAGNALRTCIRWLLDSPFSRHLIGIHVAAGFTEEWFYHFTGSYHDLSPVRIEAFREWLRHKYHDRPGDLRQAWGRDKATFETALPADISGELRRREWRDPALEQDFLDTFSFHAETMADDIRHFCRIVKEASGRRLLTGAFYGYHFYVTDPRRGHGALETLLECPDLDYLSSPNVYDRIMGEDWPPMAAVQSIQLHGKLWMAENDTRTSLTTLLKDRRPAICPPGQYESGVWLGPRDIRTSVALLEKDLGRMLCYGYGGWWFDMWGGWFSDPALQEVLRKSVALTARYCGQEMNLPSPQVCVITDEKLLFRDASFGGLVGDIYSNRSSLGRSGSPYDLYLRCDSGRLPEGRPYRAIWLLGISELTPEETERFENWLSSGISVIWTGLDGTTIYPRSGVKIQFPGRLKWSAEELRKLWKECGAHVYLDTDDVLYAGKGWMSIHTVPGGERNVQLPFPARVIDPLSGDLIAGPSSSFHLRLAPDSTTLLRIEPSEATEK